LPSLVLKIIAQYSTALWFLLYVENVRVIVMALFWQGCWREVAILEVSWGEFQE
jgi:hypothetical protein